MGEGVRNDIALSSPLQSIVSNGRGCLQRSFNVAGFDELPLGLCSVCPYARKTICLQLYSDLQRVRVNLVHSTLRLLHFRQYSKLVLNVMTDFVGNHISL